MITAVQLKLCEAQFCLFFLLVSSKYLGSLANDEVGAQMLLICFASLGVAASQAVRLPGLLLIVSLLAVAIGIEGALQHRSLGTVLADAVWMLVAVESAYVAMSLLWNAEPAPVSHRKA